MKPLTLLSIFLLFAGNLFAQDEYTYKNFNPLGVSADFAYGSATLQELNMTAYKGDSTLNAVVLNEYGNAFFVSNTTVPPIQYEYHVKIKILNTEGLKKGTVEIPLYSRDKGSYDNLRYVKGVTYYKDAAGKQQSIALKESDVKRIKIDEHNSKATFIMPNLSKGCVIEYRYVLETPYVNNFKTWMFQADVPKIRSVFEVSIPQLFGYEVSLKGALPLTGNTFKEVGRCFFLNGVNYACMNGVYVMENIPAFVAEPYMPSPKNYMSGIYFQLTDMAVVSNFADRNMSVRRNVGKSWKDFTDYMITEESFGDQLKKKFPFKSELNNAIANKSDELDKAKAVFKLIQTNFTWNGFNAIFSTNGVKNSFESRKGSVADINLSLISALNTAGLNADAVLISTHDNMLINKEMPSFNELNYIIARVNIGGKSYFADATEPFIAFGELPSRCINDKGFAITLKGNGDWVELPQDSKAGISYDVNLTVQPGNKFKGTVVEITNGEAAAEKRKEVKGFATQREYLDEAQKGKLIKISSANIEQQDDTDVPFKITYIVEGDIPADNMLKIAGLVPHKMSTNPFKAAKRNYVVDLARTIARSYKFTINGDADYQIGKVPQTTTESLPNNAGGLTGSVKVSDNQLELVQQAVTTKPRYSVEEYPYLRTMINKVNDFENGMIELKQKL